MESSYLAPLQSPISPDEGSSSETPTGIEPAVAVHLVNQTSHLTLSAVEAQDMDSPAPSRFPNSTRSSSPRLIASMALDNDAQPCLRVTGGGAEAAPGAVPGAVVATQPVTSGEATGATDVPMSSYAGDSSSVGDVTAADSDNDQPKDSAAVVECRREDPVTNLTDLPNEVLLQILGYLDICDLLSTSRISHHLRRLSVAPVLHSLRLRRTRASLSPLLHSPARPSLADLLARSIFLTHTTVVSRRLARSLVCIRLSRRLAARPSPEALVQRCVLPPECAPWRGRGPPGGRRDAPAVGVAPALVARRRAVERERVKDRLRRWVEKVWRGEVEERSEGVRRWEERFGVGRVWRLRRFWENVSRDDSHAAT